MPPRLKPCLVFALVLIACSPPLRAAEFVVRGGAGALALVDATGRGAQVGGVVVGTPGAAPRGQSLEVVARGTDDALWRVVRSSTGAWGGFERVEATLTGSPSCVARGSRLEVVARGSDGACWHVAHDGSGWTDWKSLGGSFPERATFGIASRDSASLDVFARGMDGRLWANQLGPSGWTGFTRLDGALGSDPSAVARGADRLDVVALDHDLHASVKSWTRASGWSAWTSIGGTFAAGTSLGIAADGPDGLIVAGIGTDGRIWASESRGGSWSAWTAIGAERPASSATPVIVASSSAAQRAPAGNAPIITPVTIPVGAVPTVAASGVPIATAPTLAVTPELLARLGRAQDAPWPGCGDEPCVRVTLLGFRVLETTSDAAGDGPGDEVRFRVDGFLSPDGRWQSAEPFVRESRVMGSRAEGVTGPASRRIRAGSASAQGGFARGDAHPAQPARGDARGMTDGTIPMTLFEGPVRENGQLALVLSAWEVDADEGPRAWSTEWSTSAFDGAWTEGFLGPNTNVAIPRTTTGNADLRDRPIGVQEFDGGQLAMPHLLAGNLARWRERAAASGTSGAGIRAVEFTDGTLGARHVAYVRVEVVE